MTKTRFVRALLIVAAAAASSLHPLAGRAQQAERLVPCAGAAAMPVELEYGDHADGCNLPTASLTDQFKFFGLAGDVVRINLKSYSLGFDPKVVAQEQEGDPPFAILTPPSATCSGGVVGISTGSNRARQCSFTTQFGILVSGWHSILVSDDDHTEPGSYVMTLQKVENPQPGVSVPYGFASIDAIAPETDIDVFGFLGMAGTQIVASVTSFSLGFDPRIEVLGPSQQALAVLSPDLEWCSGGVLGILTGSDRQRQCGFAARYTIAEDGLHHIKVFDDQTDEAGSYSLSMACVGLRCPNFRPSVSDDLSLYPVQTDAVGVDFEDTKLYRLRAPGGSSNDALVASVAGDYVESTSLAREDGTSVWIVRTEGAPAGELVAEASLPAVAAGGESARAGAFASYFQLAQDLSTKALSLEMRSTGCPLGVRLLATDAGGNQSATPVFTVGEEFQTFEFSALDFLDRVRGPEVASTLEALRVGFQLFAQCEDRSAVLRIRKPAIDDGKAPVNDLAENALEIRDGGVGGSLTGAIADGTTWIGGSSSSEPDVWFAYTPRGKGKLLVHACGTNAARLNASYFTDTLLSVHSQAPGDAAHQLAANDDWSEGGARPQACTLAENADRDAALEADVQNGQPVFIRVSRPAPGTIGPFSLTVVPEPVRGLAGGAALLALAALRRGARR